MQIFYADVHTFQISGQIFCHPFCQRCDQNLVLRRGFFPYLSDEVVNLAFNRTHNHLGIEKAGRTNHLLRAQYLMLLLILRGRRRYAEYLIEMVLKFRKGKRTVIERRRKTETVVDERRFSGAVAVIHAANLRNRHMRLIND